jgi:hypothetical protein
MHLEGFKTKLSSYQKEDIKITDHAELQAFVRGIDLEEVKENLLNSERLVYFKEQDSQRKHEKKYDCYFAYTKNLYHRYILTLNGKILIVTVIKINRDWQKAIG